MKRITVAVIGNPNTGKSTLINAIAGTRLQVGNWPGVTVEKKTAFLQVEDLTINLVDLPGVYSLNPYTQEEIIARDFLIKEKPDLIIDVVDATNLERNLYLLLQILELGIPVVMALNMFDEAKRKGYEIDVNALENALGIKVVPTVATRGKGVKELLFAVKEVAENKNAYIPQTLNYGKEIEEALKNLKKRLEKDYPQVLQRYPSRWLCLSLLEGDEAVLKETGLTHIKSLLEEIRRPLINTFNDDIDTILADARYGIARGINKEVVRKKEKLEPDFTERLDKIVLNRFLGIPIFLAIMWIVFKIAFDFSGPFCDWVDEVISGAIAKWTSISLDALHSPEWLKSLIIDGIIGGVGAVLVFVPLIGIFMFMITLLEGSGYLARAAFVMDRIMHSFGLHGRSFIPLVIGFGCNVPSIYATRVLETERDRKLTALLCPCISCGARLPVYVLFTGAFFAKYGATVIWSLYILGIITIVVLGIILNKTIYKGMKSVFIMELPPYRMPTFKYLMIYTWEKLKHFLIKAGTFILAFSILVWVLLNIPYGAPKDQTALARIGKVISPVFAPLGFGNWEASSALLTGIVAKEIVISTMAQIYGIQEEEEAQEKTTFGEDIKNILVSFGKAVKDGFTNLFTLKSGVFEAEEENGLKNKLQNAFTPLSAYAFMVFVLLYWPCMVFAFTLKAEFGSWKILGQALLIYTIMPWLTTFIVYQGGRLLGLG
ncbi:MAG: ferrous iron transport protein B [Thermodesulfobacterium sp.]|nr:ferrous iron transport protein B [Thermodesulfobacterium sp.]